MIESIRILALAVLAFLALAGPAEAREFSILQRDRLVAWCIVPFDSKKRGPEERAEMLERLGIKRLAYDWRAEQVPTFDAEVEAMKAHGIEITAWWMARPGDAVNDRILEVIGKHGIHPQLWLLINEPLAGNPDQAAKAKAAAEEIRPLAEKAAGLGCKVGLYNHGGWFGEPDNQLAILREPGMENVGMVYNFHHGHGHIDRFPELFERMKPRLIALNLNGMIAGGDASGRKILDIGGGDREAAMIATVLDSGWSGPVGILNHLPDQDAEVVLGRNLRGLETVLAGLGGATE